jgi:hypothetical protein
MQTALNLSTTRIHSLRRLAASALTALATLATIGALSPTSATASTLLGPGDDGFPVANDDEYHACKNTDMSVAAPGVLANDTHPVPDQLGVRTWPAASLAAGTVVGAADGSFTYTPPTDFVGVDTFVYQIANILDDGYRVTGEVTVRVMDCQSLFPDQPGDPREPDGPPLGVPAPAPDQPGAGPGDGPPGETDGSSTPGDGPSGDPHDGTGGHPSDDAGHPDRASDDVTIAVTVVTEAPSRTATPAYTG